jgi:hypothetical protein
MFSAISPEENTRVFAKNHIKINEKEGYFTQSAQSHLNKVTGRCAFYTLIARLFKSIARNQQ